MTKTSPEKLAAALKANIAKRKAASRSQAGNSPKNAPETPENAAAAPLGKPGSGSKPA